MMSGRYRAVMIVVSAILSQLYTRFEYDGLGSNRL